MSESLAGSWMETLTGHPKIGIQVTHYFFSCFFFCASTAMSLTIIIFIPSCREASYSVPNWAISLAARSCIRPSRTFKTTAKLDTAALVQLINSRHQRNENFRQERRFCRQARQRNMFVLQVDFADFGLRSLRPNKLRTPFRNQLHCIDKRTIIRWCSLLCGSTVACFSRLEFMLPRSRDSYVFE